MTMMRDQRDTRCTVFAAVPRRCSMMQAWADYLDKLRKRIPGVGSVSVDANEICRAAAGAHSLLLL